MRPVSWPRIFQRSRVLIAGILIITLVVCGFVTYSIKSKDRFLNALTRIYVLTATYNRTVQTAELTRLCNTLRNVRNVFWIVCEDSSTRSNSTVSLLNRCGIPYTYLNVETPLTEKPTPHEPPWFRPKGVWQRNLGLAWLRDTFEPGREKAVLYIADDDNTYSLEVFEEMRSTKRVSTWPVGFSGELPWEGCVTTPADRTRISQMWAAVALDRPFPVDMAGFAVNVDLLISHPLARFDYHRPIGMQESQFLIGLGLKHWSELEPKADGCQRILVWHTRTAYPNLAAWKRLESQGVVAPQILSPV